MNIADLDVDLEDLFAKTLRQEPVDLQGPLFECSLDRNQTALSSCNNLPWAERVLIAGEGMLRAAGYRPGSCRPDGWVRENRSLYWRKRNYSGNLSVSVCGEFWLVQRFCADKPSVSSYCHLNVLACGFSRWPILTRTPEAAMRLADHCDPIPRPPVAGAWTKEMALHDCRFGTVTR